MGMMQEFQKADKERKSEVATMLRGFDKQLKDHAAPARLERKAAVAAIANETGSLLKEYVKQDAERKSLVTNYMHSEVANIRSNVATVLKELAKEDAERKSEVAAIHEMVWGKAPVKKRIIAPSEPLPKEMPLEKPIAEEALPKEIRDRVFAYLADHPDGTKLVELEEKFGIARLQVARVIRTLMDDHKVEKRDQLYFAI